MKTIAEVAVEAIAGVITKKYTQAFFSNDALVTPSVSQNVDAGNNNDPTKSKADGQQALSDKASEKHINNHDAGSNMDQSKAALGSSEQKQSKAEAAHNLTAVLSADGAGDTNQQGAESDETSQNAEEASSATDVTALASAPLYNAALSQGGASSTQDLPGETSVHSIQVAPTTIAASTNNATPVVRRNAHSKTVVGFFVAGLMLTAATGVTGITLAILNAVNSNLLRPEAKCAIKPLCILFVAMFIALLLCMLLYDKKSIEKVQPENTGTLSQADAIATGANALSGSVAQRIAANNAYINQEAGVKTILAGQEEGIANELRAVAQHISENNGSKLSEQEAQMISEKLQAVAQRISDKGSTLSNQEAQAASQALRVVTRQLTGIARREKRQEVQEFTREIINKLAKLSPQICTSSAAPGAGQSQRRQGSGTPSVLLAMTSADNAIATDLLHAS